MRLETSFGTFCICLKAGSKSALKRVCVKLPTGWEMVRGRGRGSSVGCSFRISELVCAEFPDSVPAPKLGFEWEGRCGRGTAQLNGAPRVVTGSFV
jgi:hypothetical protein